MLAGALLLVGCAQPEPLRGVDLPPASMPDEIDPTQWALPFSHDFEAGFWAEGAHVYELSLDCPEAGEAQATSGLVVFAADPEVPILDGQVHLRLAGLSTTTMGPANVSFVNPDQETRALVTVVGLSDEQVQAATDCTGEIQFDDGKSAPLAPGSPFRP